MAKWKRNILLLENAEADVFLFRRILGSLDFLGSVRVVSSVSEGRQYMLGEGMYRDRRYFPLPDLIVADFNLGGATGLDFFRWIRSQPNFSHIPVAVFTGSMRGPDRKAAADLGLRVTYSKDGEFADVKREIQRLLEDTSEKGTQPESSGEPPGTPPPQE